MDIKDIANEVYKELEGNEYTKEEIEIALDNPSNIFTGEDFLSFFFFDFLTNEQAQELKGELDLYLNGRDKMTFKEIKSIIFSKY
ncbi:MAG: hypothetical protein IJZ04_07665 [Clostridia bacterium]|nr:hypothetical protein [Clostridia bacterium]